MMTTTISSGNDRNKATQREHKNDIDTHKQLQRGRLDLRFCLEITIGDGLAVRQ